MEHFVKSFDEFIGNDNAVDKSADYKAAEELADKVPDKIKGAEGNAENSAEGVDLWDYVKLEFENLHNKIWELGRKTTDKRWKSALTGFVSDLAKIEEKMSVFTERFGTVSLVPKGEEVKENAIKDILKDGGLLNMIKFRESYDYREFVKYLEAVEWSDDRENMTDNEIVNEFSLWLEDPKKTVLKK